MDDLLHTFLHSFPILVTMVCYMLFAFNVFKTVKGRRIERRKLVSFALLIGVFLLCGVCHFLWLLDTHLLHVALYWVLMVTAIALNLSYASEVMSEALIDSNKAVGRGRREQGD